MIDPALHNAWDFHCSVEIVMVNDIREYINRNGNLVIEPQFDIIKCTGITEEE